MTLRHVAAVGTPIDAAHRKRGMMAIMPGIRPSTIPRVFAFLALLLLIKTIASVLIEYRHYFPPDFDATFLRGRAAYFWGAYGWAFYTHIVAGPASLALGAVLMSERFRTAVPMWHRRLGRIQVACVLLLVAPSGLWMARYAETGFFAAVGLGSLAIATATCVALGWRAAVARRFTDHRRWMLRTFLLLYSAVIIRLIGGLATAAQFDASWLYPVSVWASWGVPLAVFESTRLLARSGRDRVVVPIN